MESEWLIRQQTVNVASVTIDDLSWLRMDVARGRSAKVHQALLYNTIPVAVKEFRVSKLTRKTEFFCEIVIMKHLSRDIFHLNVVKMVAMLEDYQAKKLFIIQEWVGQGALFNF